MPLPEKPQQFNTMQTAQTLQQKHCVPCEGGVDPLRAEQLQYYLPAVPEWTLIEDRMIKREFSFKNFKEALDFVNRVGQLAEGEGHHPDIFLHDYRKVTITLMTHAIQGLFDNDFIMAVKINNLYLDGKTTAE
jgi:4a-hydroxytetrahydrobiopterin dehydratase